MAQSIRPLSVNWQALCGPIYTYEATDKEFLASGLISPDDIPGQFPSSRHPEHLTTTRLKNGLVRLKMSADKAAARDAKFRAFLGGLMADCRLSLVRDERRAA